MTTRFDMYTPVHRAIANLLSRTLVQAGATDPADDQARQELLAAVDAATALVALHAEHEDTWYHPALEERAAGSTEAFGAEHEQERSYIAKVRAAAVEVGQARTIASVQALYSVLREWTAAMLEHMRREEAELQPLFEQHFSDEELRGIMGRLRETLEPSQRLAMLRHMLPALCPPEVEANLRGILAGVPGAGDAVLALAAEVLPPARWDAIRSRLGR